ncbi:cysteine hydrolase family protein [Actinomadura livida]|uniref:Cysteine hydrolase n=1 Tax=Actinomadura livida TaxID=79909 RepID=A0A7W7I883_9ACTN|nr:MULTISPECIES: isochorismatase family cysteine hydrolase [Actinomadura]MBB4772322.1 ureidoacrylate peracid hydrolase [Actinomadura catellatispora]GGU28535.1 isochorismatase [Actinomadura livida]
MTALATLADRLRPERTALILIDLSNDFVHPEGKAVTVGGRDVSHAQRILPVVAELADAARKAGAVVIHSQHTTLLGGASDSPVWRDARSRAAYSAPDICLDGSWGQRIVEEVEPRPGDHIVKKYRYGGFTGTNLELVLRSLGRDSVLCCGVSTNVCVDTTAREAFSRDFYVTIAADACASWDMDLHAAALRTAESRFAVVAATRDVLAAWA